MKSAIVLFLILASVQLQARSKSEIQRLAERDLFPEYESELSLGVKSLDYGIDYRKYKFNQDRTIKYYEDFQRTHKSTIQLDSPVGDIDVKPVLNPLRLVGRLWRNTAVGVFGVDRDMVKLKITSETGKTSVNCYYVLGTHNRRYLFDCGDVKDAGLFENDDLYFIKKVIETATNCGEITIVDIIARDWRYRSPTNAEELTLFNEFDREIGFDPINARKRKYCNPETALVEVLEVETQLESCEELRLYSQELNFYYDQSPQEAKDLYDREYKSKIASKIHKCENPDSQETDLEEKAVHPAIMPSRTNET